MIVTIVFVVVIVVFLMHGGYKYRNAVDVGWYDLAFALLTLALLLWHLGR